MILFSEKTNIAVHALGCMAANRDTSPITVSTLSASMNVSESHLAKVMQILARKGIVGSSRGAHGGYYFIREPADISLLDIIRAVDGSVFDPSCLLGTSICAPGNCILKGFQEELGKLMRTHLGRTTIDKFRMN